MQGALAVGWLDGRPLFAGVDIGAEVGAARGFAAIGTGGFYHAQFGNFEVDRAAAA